MTKIAKRLKDISASYDAEKENSLDDAVEILKKNASCKFDETIEIAMALNVDPKKSDQYLRGVVGMPNGTGKVVRVAVFAKDAKAEEAKKAGADIVGEKDLLDEIAAGKPFDYDVCIATPDMMVAVGKIGKILGPKGLMPNPKTGTVTFDVAKAIDNIKKGQVEYKTEKAGIVHAGVAKASFSADAIKQNIQAFIDEIMRVKPAVVKVNYVKSIYLSTTMGPSVKLVSVN